MMQKGKLLYLQGCEREYTKEDYMTRDEQSLLILGLFLTSIQFLQKFSLTWIMSIYLPLDL